ncbi:diadenylate cyclase CdaA [soil metagenome]|jgi:diadenylate cyclase|nr:TIGR00159 family protein [Gemmatimonadota bacterium]
MTGIFEQLGFLAPGWRDLLEILLVTAIFYRLLILLAGTRAIQMLLGLVLLVGIYFFARLLQLDLLQYLLGFLFQFGAIAALVVFQPELRNALAHLGQNRLLRFFNRLEDTEIAEEIAIAAEELARGGVGAIIVIERETALGEYVETGTPLQARVSAPLLSTIFSPYSPLHDGAAIIRGDIIVGAGAILPLTQFPVNDKSLGTRHRAAIGLAEETDALVVVVSEETSQISLAHQGHLRRGLDREQLAALLSTHTRRAGIAR